MCLTVLSPVGESSEPAVMLIVARSGASQNRLEPHSPQKPRRATISITAGTLDAPTGLRTVKHIYTADAGDWYELD